MSSIGRFSLSTLLLMAALLGATMTYAQHRESAAAENLIRAMRTDQFAVQGTLAAYLKKPDMTSGVALTDVQRGDFLRCLEGADTSLIVRALADVLAREMSPDQMQQALAFYGSSAGKKQVQRDLVEAQKMLGYDLAAASPELSRDERANLDRFRGTPAYAKLQEFPARIRKTPEARKAILQGSELVAAACSQAVGLARR